MADFEVKKKPEFSSTARKLETTDRAHADLFNDLYQKMFDNDNYLKQNVESKAEKDGGDIANTKVSEFAEETEQFPVPDPGEASKTLWGKMKKFVEDFKAWCTGVCLIGHIVNNCTSTANNLPLAAAQGKALMDLYTQLYSDLYATKNDIIGPLQRWVSDVFSEIYPIATHGCKVKDSNLDYDGILEPGWYRMYTNGIDYTQVHAPAPGMGLVLLRVDRCWIEGQGFIVQQYARECSSTNILTANTLGWIRFTYVLNGNLNWTTWRKLF